ncbi:toprim domain-containing protein [Vibrio anguillarum]|nr:toprim domain-containing protein [Vibrio anguillarum]
MLTSNGKYDVSYIIVESRHVAQQLQQTLNRMRIETSVVATNGHLFNYQEMDGNYHLAPIQPELIRFLKNLQHEKIMVATDNDEQGELIAHHIKMLTPSSEHTRCFFNNLTPVSVHLALSASQNNQYTFNEDLALKAAMIKMVNLRMTTKDHRSRIFATTTSLEIAKMFNQHGRCNQLKAKTYQVEGQHYHVNQPTSQTIRNVGRPSPSVTKDLINHNALSQIKLNTMEQLQESFSLARLSYIRTDVPAFAMTSLTDLQQYTLNGSPVDFQEYIAQLTNTAHYAIQNINHPQSAIEWQVFRHNRTALSLDYTDILKADTNTGGSVYLSKTKPLTSDTLRPSNEIAWLMCQSPDTASSSIEATAQKYERFFYNGKSLNENALRRTIGLGEGQYQNLWENGLNTMIDKWMSTDIKQEVMPSSLTSNPITKKEAIFELSL